MLSTFSTAVLRLLALLVAVGSVLTVAAAGDSAQDYYQAGVSANTVGEREEAFEKALAAYLDAYNQDDAAGRRNGYLCYNIGNCYYNLGQLGEAVLYYRTALRLLPGNELIAGNLQTTLQDRTNAYDIDSGGIHEKILFFHYGWSTQRRVLVATWSGLLVALLLIGLVFKPDLKAIRYPCIIAAIVFITISLSIAVSRYAPQRVGVLISKSDIRQGPGEGFAPILSTKIGEGSTIEVLSLKEDWYQVRLNDGRKGFVSADQLKLVL